MNSSTATQSSHTLPASGPRGDEVWRELHRMACAHYRAAGHFAWYFARGKLGRDPVFRAMLERGDLPARARVLDIGCGQGLLASLLRACVAVAARGAWPASWPPAPLALEYTGIELMPKDVARANAALGGLPGATPKAHIVCADLRQATLPACDLAVLLDVLHYVEPGAQDDLLARVRDALAPGGRLLLRVGDAAQRRGFASSQWIDRVVCEARSHRHGCISGCFAGCRSRKCSGCSLPGRKIVATGGFGAFRRV